MGVFTYEALLGEVEETTALRKILPADSEILVATEDRERGARGSLSAMPEHVEAQAAWRRFGDWHRARSAAKRPAPAPVAVAPSSHDHLGLYYVNLSPQDSA